MGNTGVIFDIQKMSIHDGPGIRTTVFLKGCPLSCRWCANPESQNFKPEVMSFYSRCIDCQNCIEACTKGAIIKTDKGYSIDKSICDDCLDCVEVCYAESKKAMGREISVDELMKIIKQDKSFYIESGGGVTFSGGEPLMQPLFLQNLVKECKSNNISAVIETCGYGNYDLFEEVIDYLDLIYFDLKAINDIKHISLTGISNKVILKNLKSIDNHGVEIIVRVPIIPDFNDSEKDLKKIANFVIELKNANKIELIPYHNYGVHKYESLGRGYELENVSSPDDIKLDKYNDLINDVIEPYGKKCFYNND